MIKNSFFKQFLYKKDPQMIHLLFYKKKKVDKKQLNISKQKKR